MSKLLFSIIIFLLTNTFCSSPENRHNSDDGAFYMEEPIFETVSQKYDTSNIKGLPQEGIASYYAKRFHGRKTASGDIYDSNKLTAAHKTLPFGTKVRVTNLRNENSVVVTITDRGPHHKKRVIDLSHAAAKKLGFIDKGTTRVRIEEAE